ncbi:hypothetical protein CMQ_7811 [Grosmannia clavigera kw1407]|uniref:Something about silencing protein 4 domain-containing protein n=1 Tax=Grosmannia clavigera (strain kw1407 / UAMH 11150) TaxID=655863 RepID=F0XS53_GROCL|nr:uncharacterized protein CMQ_7811 [Grosmannia clavigera kw1407]EFW99443.1 hypothetical protein CMQ_7811 [Grosmannia clavigera kw1407]
MVETLTLMPMAPGTRSRRADVPRRPAPVLLPKQKQSPLGRQQSQRLTRPPQPPPQQPQQHQQPRPSLSTASATRSIQDILNHANSMRPKRKAEPSHDGPDMSSTGRTDFDSAQQHKRLRLSVEIVSKPAPTVPTILPALPAPATALTHPNLPPKKSLRTAPSSVTAANTTTNTATSATAPTISTTATLAARPISAIAAYSSSTSSRSGSSITPGQDVRLAIPHRHIGSPSSKTPSQLAAKPREKTANGFKQELKGLQVTTEAAVAAATGPPVGGRKLRSQQATRFKSDLSAYFPEYDEVIGNEPKEELESYYPTTTATAGAVVYSTPVDSLPSGSDVDAVPVVHGYSDSLFYDLFDSHVLDFGFLSNQHKGRKTDDPLPDSVFEPHHKRAERLERSIRNSEKGRAQHEKDQIIRLLEGLQGHDWLRTMGVSGITESKKKSFEPAREHFIKGCRTILKKFRLWSLEEKRLKLEKDRAHAEEVRAQEAADGVPPPRYRGRGKGKAKAAARHVVSAVPERPDGRRRRERSSTDAEDGVQEEVEKAEKAERAESREEADADAEEPVDNDDQFDSSDADAVIAKQLRAEALARSRLAAKVNLPSKRRKKQLSSPSSDCPEPEPEPEPAEDVMSFFHKRYQRDAALSRGRRKGRTVMAWGQPVPEPLEADFDLPGEMIDDLRDAKGPLPARRRRKGKQESP